MPTLSTSQAAFLLLVLVWAVWAVRQGD